MFGRHPQSILLAGGLDVGDDPSNPSYGAGVTALLMRASLEEMQSNEAKTKELPSPKKTPLAASAAPLA